MDTPNPLKPSVAGTGKPTREEAEQAVDTLIRWMGDDPAREAMEEHGRQAMEIAGRPRLVEGGGGGGNE